MDITKHIGEFVTGADLKDFPPEGVEAAKGAIMDCLACTLAGCHEPLADILCRYVAAESGSPAASVVGRGFRTSAANAALVNGAMAHALDYDDITQITKTHPTAVLLPAALAVAEATGASGREMLLGYMVGFEVACSVGEALSEAYYDDLGWHPTGPLGAVGVGGGSQQDNGPGPGTDGHDHLPGGFPGIGTAAELRHHDQALPRRGAPPGPGWYRRSWCRTVSLPARIPWVDGSASSGPSLEVRASTTSGWWKTWGTKATSWNRASKSRSTPAAAAPTLPWMPLSTCCPRAPSTRRRWRGSTYWWTSTRRAR